MDLIVNQMVKFQVMHEAYGRLALEGFAGASVAELHLAVSLNRNTLPLLAVIEMFFEVVHDLGVQDLAVLRLEVFKLPFA